MCDYERDHDAKTRLTPEPKRLNGSSFAQPDKLLVLVHIFCFFSRVSDMPIKAQPFCTIYESGRVFCAGRSATSWQSNLA